MARRHSSSSLFLSPLSTLLLPRGSDTLWYLLALLSIFSLLLHHLSLSTVAAKSHFEGFDADSDSDDEEPLDDLSVDFPLRSSPPPMVTQSDHTESHNGAPDPIPQSNLESSTDSQSSDLPTKPAIVMDWDEDEFEGFPVEQPQESSTPTEHVTPAYSDSKTNQKPNTASNAPRSYVVEILSGSFLIMFVINYFVGKKENENIALAWAAKFATKDSIFDKNFSLLGVGDGKDEDSPLLLKEGTNSFKFYASGRRYCQGLVATMELKSRHDLLSRFFNMVVPCKDEITFEIYMNDEAMEQVVFAVAKKKAAKAMQKDEKDLQRFASLVSPPSGRKWVVEDLAVVSESKEVAGDLITEAVLEQVFGDKAFEKYGKGFISMHFSDQQAGRHKKMLVFKFALRGANSMAEMTRLVALVPYYIDLIGRYKLSSQARAKTEVARQKVAQEIYKEFQNTRQEALQKKKAERRKLLEEAEAKLSAEAIHRKDAKERARQMKKSMPKVKMTRAN